MDKLVGDGLCDKTRVLKGPLNSSTVLISMLKSGTIGKHPVKEGGVSMQSEIRPWSVAQNKKKTWSTELRYDSQTLMQHCTGLGRGTQPEPRLGAHLCSSVPAPQRA